MGDLQPGEIRSAGGVIMPVFGGRLACWLKLKGEPAQVLYETPQELMARWQVWYEQCEDWERDGRKGKPPLLVAHQFEYGQAMFFLPPQRNDIGFIGVTYPTSIQGRTTPGSIWADQCRCADFGGPCPPR